MKGASTLRHTKIIATLGPASESSAVIDALIAAGVDVFRLNFSHGTHESHAALFGRVREAASRARREIAILQDLSGPKIRTGALPGGVPIRLQAGEDVRIVQGEATTTPGCICTPYGPLLDSARPGDRLLLDDGAIELRVTGQRAGELTTAVVNGGLLGEHKGINAPGVALAGSAVTAKDADDLRFGLSLGVDWVALSFVGTAADVAAARSIAESAGTDVRIIAKIERPQALDDLDAIVAASDGVMVARGDLGLECPLEQVPRIQKEIVARARAMGRPVIVATQVLESMRSQPRPTRAEVSDAAAAVDQGADAIMLAGETASGQYPVQAVAMLAAVASEAERSVVAPPRRIAVAAAGLGDQCAALRALHGQAMCEAAVTLADSGHADAIVAITRSGATARLISSLRPGALILAVTPSAAVARRLCLWWGVRAIVSDLSDLRSLDAPLRRAAPLPEGASVVFVNVDADLAREDANFLNLQRLTRRLQA